MYWSKFLIPTLKEVSGKTEAISHKLSLRAGLVSMLTSGVYSYLPLGYRVLNRIETIISEEMDADIKDVHQILFNKYHEIKRLTTKIS